MPRRHSYRDKDYASEGVIERRMVFCQRLEAFSTDELITICEGCRHFAMFCCQHNQGSMGLTTFCHHYRLIFTDGACMNNGAKGATSGIGVALGTGNSDQLSLPITFARDGDRKRTSQRAELLAALSGLRFMAQFFGDRGKEQGEIMTEKVEFCPREWERGQWIIATDSEYVVKGMTEWLPRWKGNDFRNSQNTVSANLDLFLKIDNEIEIYEAKCPDLRIGFWHIRREYNTVADRLAKKGSREGDPSD